MNVLVDLLLFVLAGLVLGLVVIRIDNVLEARVVRAVVARHCCACLAANVSRGVGEASMPMRGTIDLAFP